MIAIREAILVEGRYDKARLARLFDTLIIQSNGFSVFNDSEKLEYLRRIAEARGLVILTDPDSAGFFIRRRLRGAIDPDKLFNAYIPDVPGKEKRKKTPSKEGLLGVEGVDDALVVQAVRASGAHILGESKRAPREGVTKAEFYALGLSGGENASEKRASLARSLGLPARLSAKELFEALNALCDRDTLLAMLEKRE